MPSFQESSPHKSGCWPYFLPNGCVPFGWAGVLGWDSQDGEYMYHERALPNLWLGLGSLKSPTIYLGLLTITTQLK